MNSPRFAATKRRPDGKYDIGTCHTEDPRIVKPFHVQYRWLFGAQKSGGVPKVARMTKSWQAYRYDLEEKDNWPNVGQALFYGLNVAAPDATGDLWPTTTVSAQGNPIAQHRCRFLTWHLADAPENTYVAYHATSLLSLRSILEVGFQASGDPERHEFGSGTGVYVADDPLGGA